MKGQTLIEVLVALGIMVVIIGAVAASVVSSLNNATFSKNQNLAAAFAQQGMESMRKLRNSDISAFKILGNSGQGYCLDSSCIPGTDCVVRPADGNSFCTPNIGGIFSREVKVWIDGAKCSGLSPPNSYAVQVKIYWNDGKCTATKPFCHKSDLLSCLDVSSVIPTP